MHTMADYILSEDLKEAVQVAEITKRPLLLKGEPGTGKTLLASFLAETKNSLSIAGMLSPQALQKKDYISMMRSLG